MYQIINIKQNTHTHKKNNYALISWLTAHHISLLLLLVCGGLGKSRRRKVKIKKKKKKEVNYVKIK